MHGIDRLGFKADLTCRNTWIGKSKAFCLKLSPLSFLEMNRLSPLATVCIVCA